MILVAVVILALLVCGAWVRFERRERDWEVSDQ